MLDIIIVNYQSTSYVLRCLRSIYNSRNGIPFKIIIQDNGSEDLDDHLKTIFPEVLLYKNECNLGFACAVNRGIQFGDSPYLMLINPDAYIEENFIFDEFIDYMESNEDVGILGPRIHNPEGTIQGSARSFPSPLTALFGRNTLLTNLFPDNPISRKNICTDRCDGKKSIEVDWVSGACMIIRREALREVGLMDQRFFIYWEDADLCRRMWEKNWKVIYSPMFSVTHQVGGSSSNRPFRAMIEFHKSSYKLFCKHSKPSVKLLAPLIAFALASKLGLSTMYKLLKDNSKRQNLAVKSKVTFKDFFDKTKQIKMKKDVSSVPSIFDRAEKESMEYDTP